MKTQTTRQNKIPIRIPPTAITRNELAKCLDYLSLDWIINNAIRNRAYGSHLNLGIGRNEIKRAFELFIQLGIFGAIYTFRFVKFCNKIDSIKFHFQAKFGTFLFCYTPPPYPSVMSLV